MPTLPSRWDNQVWSINYSGERLAFGGASALSDVKSITPPCPQGGLIYLKIAKTI